MGVEKRQHTSLPGQRAGYGGVTVITLYIANTYKKIAFSLTLGKKFALQGLLAYEVSSQDYTHAKGFFSTIKKERTLKGGVNGKNIHNGDGIHYSVYTSSLRFFTNDDHDGF